MGRLGHLDGVVEGGRQDISCFCTSRPHLKYCIDVKLSVKLWKFLVGRHVPVRSPTIDCRSLHHPAVRRRRNGGIRPASSARLPAAACAAGRSLGCPGARRQAGITANPGCRARSALSGVRDHHRRCDGLPQPGARPIFRRSGHHPDRCGTRGSRAGAARPLPIGWIYFYHRHPRL